MKTTFFKTIVILNLALFSFCSNANLSCFKEPANESQSSQTIGGMNKHDATIDGYKKALNPTQDLLACFMQSVYEGPKSVIKHCGCKQAVRESCRFDFKHGLLKITPLNGAKMQWCATFSFLAI